MGCYEREIQKEIRPWKKYYFSNRGILVLMKGSLTYKSILYPFFAIPRKVRIILENFQRDILWGNLLERNNINLVSWSKVRMNKKGWRFGH